jgi:hypothetical protein
MECYDDDHIGCPQVPMPAFETPAGVAVDRPIAHCQTDAEVAANQLIETILRQEGPSHQHLAPSHVECLGMTQCCRCEFLQLWGPGFVCFHFWARP